MLFGLNKTKWNNPTPARCLACLPGVRAVADPGGGGGGGGGGV